MSNRDAKRITGIILPLICIIIVSISTPVFATWNMFRHDAQNSGQLTIPSTSTPNTPLNKYQEVWSIDTTNNSIMGSPVQDNNNNIYYVEKAANSETATLVKRDYNTGEQLWSKSFESQSTTNLFSEGYAPLILGDCIYVLGTSIVDNNNELTPFISIYSFSTTDGTQLSFNTTDGSQTTVIPIGINYNATGYVGEVGFTQYYSPLMGRTNNHGKNTLFIQQQLSASLGQLTYSIGGLTAIEHNTTTTSLDGWGKVSTSESAPIIFNNQYVITGDNYGSIKVFDLDGNQMGADNSFTSGINYLLADSEYIYVFYDDGFAYYSVVNQSNTKVAENDQIKLVLQTLSDGSTKNHSVIPSTYPVLNGNKIICQQTSNLPGSTSILSNYTINTFTADVDQVTKQYHSSYTPSVADSEQNSFTATDKTLASYDKELQELCSQEISCFLENSDNIIFIIPTNGALILSGSNTLVRVSGSRDLNQAPSAEAGTNQTTGEGSTVQLDGSQSTDPERDYPLTYLWSASNGITLSNSTAESPTFVAPEISEITAYSFTLQVTDSYGATSIDTVEVTVIPRAESSQATPILAEDAAITVNEDSSVAINLESLITNPDNRRITITIAHDAKKGSLSQSENIVTYQPENNYFGEDSFYYQVADNLHNLITAEVSVTIIPVNDPPTAKDGTASTNQNTPVTIALNGDDVDSTVLSYSISEQPLHGILTMGTNEVIYSPNSDYSGSDVFSYMAVDGNQTNGSSAPAIIAISINAVAAVDNDNPIASLSAIGNQTNSWYTGTAAILIEAEDDTAIAAIDYSIDGISTSVAGNGNKSLQTAFNLSSNGSHTILFRAIDIAGNRSTNYSANIQIDTAAPTIDNIQINANSSTISTANGEMVDSGILASAIQNITARIYDNMGGSGLVPANLEVKINGSRINSNKINCTAFSNTQGVAAYNVSCSSTDQLLTGNNQIEIEATDLAGNTTNQSFTLKTASLISSGYCYPNPWDPNITSLKFAFSISQTTQAKIYIFDEAYQPVKTINREVSAGNVLVEWDGINDFGSLVNNGLYLYRVIDAANQQTIVKGKLVVIRSK